MISIKNSLVYSLCLIHAVIVSGPLYAMGQPGELDPSFGNNGIVTTSIGFLAYARALIIQPDSEVVVAGSSDNYFACAQYFALAASSLVAAIMAKYC